MLRIFGTVFRIYLLAVLLWIGCYLFAGPQKVPFWCALIGVSVLALTVVGAVAHRRR